MKVPPKAIYRSLHTCLWMGWVTLGKYLFLSISFNYIAVVDYYHDGAYLEEKSSTGKLPASWQLHWDVTDCHTGKWCILGQCDTLQVPGVNCAPCIDVCKQRNLCWLLGWVRLEEWSLLKNLKFFCSWLNQEVYSQKTSFQISPSGTFLWYFKIFLFFKYNNGYQDYLLS